MSLSREFVLRELMDNAMQAKKNQEWSASNRAFELVGKELGMFNHPELSGMAIWPLLLISSSYELQNSSKGPYTARTAPGSKLTNDGLSERLVC